MKLSKRLAFIYNFIQRKKYKTIYDVGTDHGLLPIYLAQNSYSGQIWATDINPQVIIKLKKKVIIFPQIHCLTVNGLKEIKQKIDLVVMTGLGTKTIVKILEDDNPLIENYLLQSQNKPTLIRQWIQKKGFFLGEEEILREKNYYYHYLFINKKKGTKVQNQKDIIFGPLLLKIKNSVFCQFWAKEKAKELDIMQKTNQTKIIAKQEVKIKLIENILEN